MKQSHKRSKMRPTGTHEPKSGGTQQSVNGLTLNLITHPDIVYSIMTHLSPPELAKVMRVNTQLYSIATQFLYCHVVLRYQRDLNKFMWGATPPGAITRSRAKRSTQWGVKTGPEVRETKIALLQHVQSLTIDCPLNGGEQGIILELPNVQVVRVCKATSTAPPGYIALRNEQPLTLVVSLDMHTPAGDELYIYNHPFVLYRPLRRVVYLLNPLDAHVHGPDRRWLNLGPRVREANEHVFVFKPRTGRGKWLMDLTRAAELLGTDDGREPRSENREESIDAGERGAEEADDGNDNDYGEGSPGWYFSLLCNRLASFCLLLGRSITLVGLENAYPSSSATRAASPVQPAEETSQIHDSEVIDLWRQGIQRHYDHLCAEVNPYGQEAMEAHWSEVRFVSMAQALEAGIIDRQEVGELN